MSKPFIDEIIEARSMKSFTHAMPYSGYGMGSN